MKLLILTLLFSFYSCILFTKRTVPVVHEEPVTDSFPEAPPETPTETELPVPILSEPIKPVSSGLVRWPRDQDLAFTIAYCSDTKLQLQWRQRCGDFDSDWYDMMEKGLVDPMDADFMVKRASKLFAPECIDTVIVMSSKMRNFPKSGCEWSFRTRLISKRNIYEWVILGERIVLADPGEFEKVSAPRIELIKPIEKTPN